MSRLNTFLTYEDYDLFVRVFHCSLGPLNRLNIKTRPIPCVDVSCAGCILFRDNPFKAEALLTMKET